MSNHRETLYGKGDFRRPENNKKFQENFDAIFGRKERSIRDERAKLREQKRNGQS